MSGFDPSRPSLATCERCGRRVVDGSTDFGNGLVLRPTCEGIRVSVNGERTVFVAASELREFLDRAYGS